MNIEKTTMLIGWEEPKGMEEKLKLDLKLIPELDRKGYEHKREQFYLMHMDGRSDQFLDYFRRIDVSVNTVTMDLIRITAKLCGEKYAQETLIYRSFTIDEAISRITDELTKRRYEILPDIQAKLDAFSHLEEELAQMRTFLQKKNDQTELTEDASKEDHMSRELEHQKEMMVLKGELKEKDAELKAKDIEIASLKASYEEKIRYMKHSFKKELEKERGKDQGGFFRRRRRMEEEREEQKRSWENMELFLAKILSESKYKEDQLDEITAAIGEGLSIEEVRCLCNPGMPATGMKKLKEFFLKKKEEEDYGC